MSKVVNTLVVALAAAAPFAVCAQEQDVVRIDAGAQIDHHSNVFRLADGVDPTPLFGKSSRSDTILKGILGINFNREVSRQRFRADARLEPTKFSTYSKFDYTAYNAGVGLDWGIGPAFYGTLGARANQGLTSFLYVAGVGDRNLERRTLLNGSAGFRFTPDWSVFVGADQTVLSNSLNFYKAADFTATGTEAGVRYDRGTGTQLALVLRNTQGKYDNLQTSDLSGALLATPISNDYKQNALLLRLQYKPSDDSRLFGDVGYTERKYSTLPARDFSGPTAVLGVEWKPTGAFDMRVDLIRDLQAPGLLSFNYVDYTELRLVPKVALTGKIAATGLLSYANLNYKGDPSSVGGLVRKDDLTILGAGLSYEVSRTIRVNAELRHESRGSNVDAFKFKNNILSLGVLAGI